MLQLQTLRHLTVIAVTGGVLGLNSFYIYSSLVSYDDVGAALFEFSSNTVLIFGYALLSLAMNGLLFLVMAVLYSHRIIGPHEKSLRRRGRSLGVIYSILFVSEIPIT